MSFNYEVTGYLRQPRDPSGEFMEGDVLPERLPQEDYNKLQVQNAGAGEIVESLYASARAMADLAFLGADDVKRRIAISGHVQTPGTASPYLQVNISVSEGFR